MRIAKGSISRDVPDYKAAEYAAKGYVPEDEQEEKGLSLESMTIARLAEYALDKGIDLAGAKKKADMVSIIKANLKSDLLPKEGPGEEE